ALSSSAGCPPGLVGEALTGVAAGGTAKASTAAGQVKKPLPRGRVTSEAEAGGGRSPDTHGGSLPAPPGKADPATPPTPAGAARGAGRTAGPGRSLQRPLGGRAGRSPGPVRPAVPHPGPRLLTDSRGAGPKPGGAGRPGGTAWPSAGALDSSSR